jgi:hypothetical protein
MVLELSVNIREIIMKFQDTILLFFICVFFGLAGQQNCTEQIEEAFVSFATENYFPLLEVTIESIHAFSTRPIIAYGINADIPFDTNKYPRLIKRRIDKPANMNIYFEKLNCIIQSNVKYGVYVEADDIVNYCVDELFEHCKKIEKYPLCPIHPQDPNDEWPLMARLGVTEKTNPYVHAHILFSEHCIPFLQECFNLAISLGNIGANWDETLLNVMLWKYKVHNYYLPVFDPLFGTVNDYLRGVYPRAYITGHTPEVTYHMIHGCKNASQAKNILQILKANVGLPTRAYLNNK